MPRKKEYNRMTNRSRTVIGYITVGMERDLGYAPYYTKVSASVDSDSVHSSKGWAFKSLEDGWEAYLLAIRQAKRTDMMTESLFEQVCFAINTVYSESVNR